MVSYLKASLENSGLHEESLVNQTWFWVIYPCPCSRDNLLIWSSGLAGLWDGSRKQLNHKQKELLLFQGYSCFIDDKTACVHLTVLNRVCSVQDGEGALDSWHAKWTATPSLSPSQADLTLWTVHELSSCFQDHVINRSYLSGWSMLPFSVIASQGNQG